MFPPTPSTETCRKWPKKVMLLNDNNVFRSKLNKIEKDISMKLERLKPGIVVDLE
jgi:hypothetical protein